MLRHFILVSCLSLFAISSTAQIHFVENKGQLPDQDFVLFYADANGMRLSVTTSGLSYVQHKTLSIDSTLESPAQFEIHQTDMILAGAKISNRENSHHRTTSYSNFFIGENIRVTRAAHYDSLLFTNIYPGIDWQVFVSGGTFKHQFIVRDPENIGMIRMNFSGPSDIAIDDNGSRLNLVTPFGKITEGELVTVSLVDNRIIPSSYVLHEGYVGFSVNDQSNPFVVDPPLLWATYLGGSDLESPFTLTTDDTSNVFVSGLTWSLDFPTVDPGTGGIYSDTLVGTNDVFVCKFDSARHLLWSTYFGSTGNEDCRGGLNVDENGHIYLVGIASTTSLPLINTGNGMYFQATQNGFWDLFIATFHSDGILFRSTFYGGNNYEEGFASALDGNGHLCIAGRVSSNNFPVSNPGNGAYYDAAKAGTYDDFLLEFDTTGVRRWSTFFGGSNDDGIPQMCFNAEGELYFMVGTQNSNYSFPSVNPGAPAYYYSGPNPAPIAISKFGVNRNLIWSTTTGPMMFGSMQLYGMTCSPKGNLIVSGFTSSPTFPIVDPGSGAWTQATNSNWDMPFIMEFDTSLALIWSTVFFQPSTFSTFYTVVCDSSDNLYAGGVFWGASTCNPLSDGAGSYFQPNTAGGYDFLLTCFNSSRQLQWSTFYGGSTDEEQPANSLYHFNTVVDTRQHLLVLGCTESVNIPLRNRGNGAYMDSSFAGSFDGVLLEFSAMCDAPSGLSLASSDSSFCFGDSLSISVTSTNTTHYSWTTSGGVIFTDTSQSNIHSVFLSDTGVVCITSTNVCGSANICTTLNVLLPQSQLSTSDTSLCLGDSLQLTTQGVTSITWSPGLYLNDSLSPSPIATPLDNVHYVVVMDDASGCRALDSVFISVWVDCDIEDCSFNIHPNPAQGYVIIGTDCRPERLEGVHFRLYDLLGQIVYEVEDMSQGWNNLLDFELADAMYFYVVEDDTEILSSGKILNVQEMH